MDVFVARQPIFDRHQRVYAYELLFRSGFENFFSHRDDNQASLQVINHSFFLVGMETLTGGKRGFINFTHQLLLQEYASLLPPHLVGIELLENIELDTEIIAACQKLKTSGYLLILDDVVTYQTKWEPLIALADIIKVDFAALSPSERKHLVQQFRSWSVPLLAEKVETYKDFREALDLGYTYFQGYFFSKPVILSSKDVPVFKLTYLQILQEINRPNLSLDRLEQIIQREVSLSYKLLRYINSVAIGLRKTISSIKQALLLMGETQIRKWVSMIVLANLGVDKPLELVASSLIRAKFCECLGAKMGLKGREMDLFLLGMFSLIDVLMGRPMDDILANLPIAEAVKTALLGGKNRYRDIYDLALAYEKGEWQQLSQMITHLEAEEVNIPALYLQAISWATQNCAFI